MYARKHNLPWMVALLPMVALVAGCGTAENAYVEEDAAQLESEVDPFPTSTPYPTPTVTVTVTPTPTMTPSPVPTPTPIPFKVLEFRCDGRKFVAKLLVQDGVDSNSFKLVRRSDNVVLTKIRQPDIRGTVDPLTQPPVGSFQYSFRSPTDDGSMRDWKLSVQFDAYSGYGYGSLMRGTETVETSMGCSVRYLAE